MKRIILHIGTHKTGTTSLQEYLAYNADVLAEQGICYPAPKVDYPRVATSRNGHFLYRYATDLTLPKLGSDDMLKRTYENIEDFRRIAKEQDFVILSDERLWYQGARRGETWPIIKDFLEELGFTQIEAIVYLRRQDQFVTSMWNQWVKCSFSLADDLATYARGDMAHRMMDYDARLRDIESALGKENVHVRAFQRDRLVGGDIRLDFFPAIGYEPNPELVLAEQELNPSLSSTVVEIKRQANKVESYRAASNYLRHAAEEATKKSAGKSAMSLMTPDLQGELLDKYAEGNARIARDYFDGEGETPFSPVKSRSKEPAGDDVEALLVDTIQFFTSALTAERKARLNAQARLKELEKRVDKLERSLDKAPDDNRLASKIRKKRR